MSLKVVWADRVLRSSFMSKAEHVKANCDSPV